MVLFMLIIVLLLLVVLFYISTQRRFQYWKKRNVYYETPIPIFGNMLNVALRKEQIGPALKRIYDNTGDNVPYFGMFVFHEPNLVLKSPEIIKKVLIKDFPSFPNRNPYVNEKVDPISANTLFALKNAVWKNLRNKMTPVFTSAKLKNMVPLIGEVTEELKIHLNELNNQEIDIKDLSKRYGVDVISSCAFGINSNSLRNPNSEIKKMVNKLLDMTGFRRSFAVFSWFFCPLLVDIFRLPFTEPESAEFLAEVYKQSAKERKENNLKRNDLIDMLNELKSEETQDDLYKFDVMKMCSQAIVFFNAGGEGTSILFSLCLYELAVNPEIQETLRNEIKRTMGSSKQITYDALFGMEYLDLIMKETLRKYPFIQFIQRYAEKDYTFEETGLRIEKGTQIMIPVLALNYDPKYFPHPEKFDPERFRGDKMKDHQYVFLPFGDGPRKCIGERFALLAVKMGITMFLKDHQVYPGKETDIPLQFTKSATFLTPKNGTIFLKVSKTDD